MLYLSKSTSKKKGNTANLEAPQKSVKVIYRILSLIIPPPPPPTGNLRFKCPQEFFPHNRTRSPYSEGRTLTFQRNTSSNISVTVLK